MSQQPPNLRTRLPVFEALEQLETMATSATKLPLTKRAVINPTDLMDLVARVRASLPPDITQAQEILRYRDSLVGQAQAEAQRLRTNAEQESLLKVSEAQVVHDARDRASQIQLQADDQVQEILKQAEAQAVERVRGADEYSIDVLRKLEGELEALLSTARRGLQALGADSEQTGPQPVPPANGHAS